MPYTQTHTYLSLTTPLGPDKLLLHALHGEEQLSGLFHFTLEMVAEDKNLDFAVLVGHSATITLRLENGETRYLNGIVGRFYQGGSDMVDTPNEFLDFLPTGRGFAALRELVRFYGRDAFSFELRLSLRGDEAPGFRQ